MNFGPRFEPFDEVPRPPWLRPADQMPASSPASWALRGEPWEQLDDAYDGEVALFDLERHRLSNGGTTRILARFVTIAFLRSALSRPAPMHRLRAERAAAAAYTDALRAPAVEARALRAIVQLARRAPPRRIVQFLEEAAAAAHRSRDRWGAFALHREAYRLAAARGWHADAARAADAIALLAKEGGGRRSPRLWRMRAFAQLRQADRAAARSRP